MASGYYNPILTFENVVFREFTLCLSLMALQSLIVFGSLFVLRLLTGAWKNPEDAAVRQFFEFMPALKRLNRSDKGKKGKDEKDAPVDPQVLRLEHASASNCQALILFFCVGFMYMLVGLPAARM